MISRRSIFRIHKWCGLVACDFVLVQAITGCALVFRDQLGRAFDPAGMARHSASGAAALQDITQALRRANPGYEVRRIILPLAENGTYFVHLADRAGSLRYASVDPGDGRILEQGNIWTFPLEVALQIHEKLLSGPLGVIVVISLGVVLLTMIATGLIYWWPRPGRWRKGLAIDGGLPPRLVLRQAHRSLAVAASVVIGLSAVTGIVLAIALLVDKGPTFAEEVTGRAPGADIDVDQGVALAKTRFPGRGIRDLRLPATDQLNVYFWAPERNPTAVHLVGVDLATGRIAGVVPARDDPGLWVIPQPIHTGEILGWAGRVVILVSGLCLAVLAVSGFTMWRQVPRKSS
jgi:uncharacterized iron-regulated membrane protein